MPRKKLIKTNLFYYHISTRSNHKEWFKLSLDQVWDISVLSFKKAQKNAPAIISQFVLMANHYHLLIKTPDCNIDVFMYWFNKTFSDELRKKSGTINRMFGGRYKWSLIKNEYYFFNVFKYIYQNPLRANLVDFCEQYKYSTFYYTSSCKKLPFMFHPILEFEEQKEFINEIFIEEKALAISKGLKKTDFKEVFSRNY